MIIWTVFVCLIVSVTCDVDIATDEDLSKGVYGPVVSVDYKHFPLRKCHCGANEYWDPDTQLCSSAETFVDFITSYHPQHIERVPTGEVSDLFISDIQCEESIALQISGVAFNEPNSVHHQESGDTFQRFCIEHVMNETGDVVNVATVCLPKLTIPSCCPPEQIFLNDTMTCHPSASFEFTPPVHIGTKHVPEALLAQYAQDMPRCNLPGIKRTPLERYQDELVGSLHYQQSHMMFFKWDNSFGRPVPSSVKLPVDYCVAAELDGDTIKYAAYTWDEWAFDWCYNVSLAYTQQPWSQCEQTMYWVLLPLLVLSSVCLIVILGVHSILSELRKSLGTKITICHVASLLAGFLVLILLHAPIDFNCKVFGPIVQVCFLATFFWLNVMCFDIWWKLRSSPSNDTVHRKGKKFFRYSLYAWGSPILIGIVTVVMDNVPQLQDNPNIIVPGFGKHNCWFSDNKATMTYYFGVIGVLMVLNLLFFVAVFAILVRANCVYNEVLRHDVTNSRRWCIYFKIFAVMGLTWICEFLSWQEGTCQYWVVTDILNSLRGLTLFVIFFGNKSSMNKLRTRFSSMNEKFQLQFNQSMNNLRKLSLKPNVTAESTLESYKTDSQTSEKAEQNDENPPKIADDLPKQDVEAGE